MRLCATCWIFCLLLTGQGVAAWNPVMKQDREYVAMSQVAAFYGLSQQGSSSNPEQTWSGPGKNLRLRRGSRQALIQGVRHWLSFPVLLENGEMWISRVDLARTLEPLLRPGQVPGLRPVTTVVLDAGHGGHDRGARSRFGMEKEYTLDVAVRLRKLLEKSGFRVVMTRSRDVFLSLESRPNLAKRYPNAIFVSLHFNSADWNPAARGLEVFAIPPVGTPPTGQSQILARDRQVEPGHSWEMANLLLATTVHHAVLAKTGQFDRGVKRARFAVLKNATAPAVLIEGGFLSNTTEAAQVARPEWRQKLAEAIAQGIGEYQKLVQQQTSPRQVQDYGRAATTEFVPE